MKNNSVDISGLSKAEVLAALVNHSSIQGMPSFYADVMGDKKITVADAQAFIDKNNGMRFDYVEGKVVKCNIKGKSFDPSKYDRDNGEGAASDAINTLRMTTPTTVLKGRLDPDYFSKIKRTAQHGLDEACEGQNQTQKWIAIWALDVLGETMEYYYEPDAEKQLCELGDVMWAIAASAMLLNVPQSRLEKFNPTNPPATRDEVVCSAHTYAELAKKTARDNRHVEPLQAGLVMFYIVILDTFGYETINQAINAVDDKLWNRYPDGFNAEDSINRVQE